LTASGVTNYFDPGNKLTPSGSDDDTDKEAPTIERMKANDDDDDSLSWIATESGHKTVAFRPITTATIQSIIQNRQLAFNRSQKNILEMIGNETEVQYLPIETKPQVSDVTKVRGDGNCFFRCLSLNITGTETNHQVLRKAVVDYMKEHNEDLPEDYLQKSKMWKDRIWATDMEISAAANFLQTDIYT